MRLSWKCDICDSYNEESSRQCYVCGQARSAESIREGKIKEREERVSRINTAIINRATGVLRLFFILGLSGSLVAVIVTLIIKISGGDLDTIWQSLKTLVERMVQNVNTSVDGNLRTLIARCSTTPIEQLPADAKAIWSVAADNGSYLIRVISTVLPNTAGVNLQNCYTNGVLQIGNRILINTSMFGMIVSTLMADTYSSIGNLFETIKGLFETATSHFN